MFIVNTNITVNYVIPNTIIGYSHSDFDVKIVKPNGDVEVITSAINEEDFIAPSNNTLGGIRFNFSPDSEGTWNVTLYLKNASDNFVIYYEYFLKVSTPDTEINQQICL